jgi:peptidoglycan/LPS O-acetylase OafA/YrhL
VLSSPYPVPRLRVHKVAMVLGWVAGMVAGAWVLVSPPKSYDAIGLALTTVWGAFLLGGSLLVMIANAFRKYKIEIPGLILALGGVAIYDYLSWYQTLTDSLGSGPRACLLLVLAAHIVARIRILMHIDRQARRMASLRDGGTGE